MVDGPTPLELDQKIAAIRENLRFLVEQAAGRSGAADESHADDMIAAQEVKLSDLIAARQRIGD